MYRPEWRRGAGAVVGDILDISGLRFGSAGRSGAETEGSGGLVNRGADLLGSRVGPQKILQENV